MAIEFLDDVKVEANIEVTGYLTDSASSSGASGYILSSTTIGTAWIDPNTLDNIGSTDLTLSANRILYFGAGALGNKTLEFLDNSSTSVRIIKFTDADIEMAKEVHLKSVSATTVPLHFHGPSSSAFSVSLQAPTLLASTAYTLPDADGTTKQVLSTNASGILSWEDGINIGNTNLAVSGTATSRTLTLSSGNGSNFKILDYNTSPFILFQKGITDIYSILRIQPQSGSSFGGLLQIYEKDVGGSGGYVGLQVGASHSASVNYTLPTGPPASNQVLQSTSTGVMSWVAGGGTDTNIANTNLTTDNAGRTLTLINSGSWGIYDNNASMVASFSSGTILLQSTVQIISNTASANALEFRGNTSSGPTYVIGLQAPDSVTADAPYILPQLPATSGQVLQSTSTGVMSWGDAGASSPTLIASGGGRAYVTTSTDNNDRALVLGGSIGFSYYNWSVQMRAATSSFTGLGVPGTTTTSVTPSSAAQGAFQVLKSGTIRIQGTCEGQNNSEVYNDKVYIYVFKLPLNIVAAMGNGSGQANSSYTLVASAECTMPVSGASQRPQSFESSNGETVSAGDWVFASLSFAGTVTATRYFYTNFSMATL
jgi:hypothetical protein